MLAFWSSLTLARALLILVEGLFLFLAASVVFDLVHYLLHQCLNARSPWLKRVGALHQAHHDFYTNQLEFDTRYTRANLLLHVIPEYLNQVLFTLCGFFLLGWPPVIVALSLATLIFLLVAVRGGKDEHHVAASKRKGRHHYDGGLFVTADYHTLHHLHPDRYFSSYVTLFDRLMGTACQVQGRKVALTGASGAFGQALRSILEREGAVVTTLKHGVDFLDHDASPASETLRHAEILVLAHGAKGDAAMSANCDSFVTLIEHFVALREPSLSPPEIWAVGSEIECHPAFGDPVLQGYKQSKLAFARHARRYYDNRDVIYRHIVPSAFRSAMGPGLISAQLAAQWAYFLIQRGFRYVPVTYTGVALVNYIKFIAFTQPKTTQKPRKLEIGRA